MFSCRSLVILIALCVFGAINSLSIGRNSNQRVNFGSSFNNFSRPVNQSRVVSNPQGRFQYNNRNLTFGLPPSPSGQFLGRPANVPLYNSVRNNATWSRPAVNANWPQGYRLVNYSRPYFG